MDTIFTSENLTIYDNKKVVHIQYLENEYTPEFEKYGFFDEDKSMWCFDKTKKEFITFISKIIGEDITKLYKDLKEPISPKSQLKKFATSSSSSSSEGRGGCGEDEYPSKIGMYDFHCEINDIDYYILIGNYSEKSIVMYVGSKNTNTKEVGTENKLFSETYKSKIEENKGIFNFNLKTIKGQSKFEKSPGWCFSKTNENLNDFLSFFTGENVNIPIKSKSYGKKVESKHSNKYVDKSTDLLKLMLLPLIKVDTIKYDEKNSCSYGPIGKMNEMEFENIVFESKTKLNRLVIYN